MDDLIKALARNHREAELTPAERAMLEYALKLTREPGAMGQEDVEALRAAGLDDRAIHDACAIAAYFAFVNRIAEGLQVQLEPRFGR